MKSFSAYVPSLLSLLPKMQAMMVIIKYTVIVRAIEDARITFLTLRPLSRPLLDMLLSNINVSIQSWSLNSTRIVCAAIQHLCYILPLYCIVCSLLCVKHTVLLHHSWFTWETCASLWLPVILLLNNKTAPITNWQQSISADTCEIIYRHHQGKDL